MSGGCCCWSGIRLKPLIPRNVFTKSSEDQVAAAPERIALSFSGETMTYATLNEQANRLARALVRRGVRPNQPVGLCAERSIELIVALLAILKAGGAYLPLDPTHPDERLRLQIADGKIGVVLALSEHFARCETMSVEPILLDGAGAAWRSLPGENLSAEERGAEHAPSQLAYVLYTSGSTGQPKGVLIEHKSVVRLVKGVSYAHLGADERYLQLSPLAFDASTFEIWAPLLNGGRLAILPPGRFAMEGLAHAMETEQVSTLWLTTGLFHTIVDENPDCLKGVKQLLTGGEVTSGNHVARLLARRADLTIIHCYGPTEGTTFTTANAWTRTQTIPDVLPLGRPISNTQVYVLDGRLSPQPVGVAGELYVGGDGVARGYLNRPDLTDFVFIENPFPETPGSRLYRTGDFARWLADGQLEFLRKARRAGENSRVPD
ncbi:MAG: amino acid adenylation domain-containing protein [Kiritimatiellae bacterium]|nr:amino acid adenylation domain-containing protein [Kiritimatiellia bacterium]